MLLITGQMTIWLLLQGFTALAETGARSNPCVLVMYMENLMACTFSAPLFSSAYIEESLALRKSKHP